MIIYFSQILSLPSIQLLPCQHGFQQHSGTVNLVPKLCNYLLVHLETYAFSHVLWISKPVDSRSLSITQQHASMRHLHLLRGMLCIQRKPMIARIHVHFDPSG